MVKQGDIIKINFNPQLGHEQAGYRPAVVVSNNTFNNRASVTLICPISNTKNDYPLHIRLDSRTQTTGAVLCQHVRAVDLSARMYRFVEELPHDLLKQVIDVITAEIEII